MIIVATTSLPAVDRPNADRWNPARSCQYEGNLRYKDNLKYQLQPKVSAKKWDLKNIDRLLRYQPKCVKFWWPTQTSIFSDLLAYFSGPSAKFSKLIFALKP